MKHSLFPLLPPSFRRKPIRRTAESSEKIALAERTLDWIPPVRRIGSSRGMTKLRGFTLLEVMIALLVITLGMAAVINTTSESGWKSAQLRHKTVATWVAQNQIVKYRANRIWGNARSQSGKVEMANIDWVWRMKISATDDPSLRRLDVEVFIEGEDALKASLTGFIARI